MSTKITNVYVKNRAAGETSFKEVDSVYAGDTRVFGHIYSTPTTPMGIIPLKRASSEMGPYGEFRTLYTQAEMDTTISTAWGFLITPVYAYGSYYVPNSLDYYDYLTVSYKTGYSIGSFKIPGKGIDDSDWITTEKKYTPEGEALFAPTLFKTLYMPYCQNFSFETSQYCYLCNRDTIPLTIDAKWFRVPYKVLQGGGPSDSFPKTIYVYVGIRDSDLGTSNLVKSQIAAEGRCRKIVHNIYVK